VLLARVAARVRESLIAVGELVTAWDSDRRHGLPPPGQSTLETRPGSLGELLGGWVATLAASGVRVALSIEGAREHLGDAAEDALAVALDEAIANVVRHSAGTSVAIDIRFDLGGATLRVEDPGPYRDSHGGAGAGLKVLARRLEAIDGRLRAGPTVAGGFTLEATVPAYRPEMRR